MEPTSWPNRYVSDCAHALMTSNWCDDANCIWPCDLCDADDNPSTYGRHIHCDGCGATRCHGWWWRLKRPMPPRDPADTRSGLDKVRDAVRAARGGDAPATIRAYA